MESIRNKEQVPYKLFALPRGERGWFLIKKEVKFNLNWNCEIASIEDV